MEKKKLSFLMTLLDTNDHTAADMAGVRPGCAGDARRGPGRALAARQPPLPALPHMELRTQVNGSNNCRLRQFSVLIRMETFTEDMEYFLARVGLSEQLGVEWKHRTHSEQLTFFFLHLTFPHFLIFDFTLLCILILQECQQ